METEQTEWAIDQDPLADPAERAHLHSVLDSFRQYRSRTLFTTTHVRRQAFYALPQSHWQLLAAKPVSFLDTLVAVDDAIEKNAKIAEAIYETAVVALGLARDNGDDDDDDDKPAPWEGAATLNDHAKARSTIHQLYRDWSAEGAAEREPIFARVFADLETRLDTSTGAPLRVLVPGAGLGRLVYELCRRGHAAEGNELSYHQLFASSLVLNHTRAAAQFALCPFAAQFGNQLARADQLREVRVPDVCPAVELAGAGAAGAGSMSMTAGDFCELYGPDGRGEARAFDAVATVFFIDTAPDLILYIRTVAHTLRPGGIWSNVGPLLWHFDPPEQGRRGDGAQDGIGSHGSFEPSHEEVLALVEHFGFRVEEVETGEISTGYVGNERSLLQSVYKPVHWVARRL